MNLNIRVLSFTLGGSIVILLLWIFYLLNINQQLKEDIEELQENYEAVDGFNHILQYELEVSRDSVRLVNQRNIELTKESEDKEE